jgi:hypothetical protein
LITGGPAHAFFFAEKLAKLVDLGVFQAGDVVTAGGINDSDLVVGDELTPLATGAMASMQAAPRIVADPEVSGLWRVGTRGRAIAHDVVIGSSRPFVWSATTGMEDLNTLIPSDSGWTLETSSGIDRAGEIVGAGLVDGAAIHGFMLTPEK